MSFSGYVHIDVETMEIWIVEVVHCDGSSLFFASGPDAKSAKEHAFFIYSGHDFGPPVVVYFWDLMDYNRIKESLMHDSRKAPLQKGDRVLIEAEVVSLDSSDPNYCNVTVQVITPDQPDTTPMSPPRIYGINTKMLTKVGSSSSG